MATKGTPRVIDAQVQAARERGDFEHLAGHGKPLEEDPLQGLTPEQRTEALLMRTLGEVLPEVSLTREIRALRQRLSLADVPSAERAALSASLTRKVDELREALKARKTGRSDGAARSRGR